MDTKHKTKGPAAAVRLARQFANGMKGNCGCAATIQTLETVDAGINHSIALRQCDLKDWTTETHAPLNHASARIQRWAVALWKEFIPAHWAETPVSRPEMVFRLERIARTVPGHYQFGRDGAGLKFVVILNLAHLGASEIEVAALVLHMLLHCFEEAAGFGQAKKYHSAWFLRQAVEYGIPGSRFGCSCEQLPDNSRFIRWAHKFGLTYAPFLTEMDNKEKDQPKRTRMSYICNCPDSPVGEFAKGLKVGWMCPVCGVCIHPKARKSKSAAASQLPRLKPGLEAISTPARFPDFPATKK